MYGIVFQFPNTKDPDKWVAAMRTSESLDDMIAYAKERFQQCHTRVVEMIEIARIDANV